MGAILTALAETALGAILKAVFARLFGPKPAPQVTSVAAAETQLRQIPDAKVADVIAKDGL